MASSTTTTSYTGSSSSATLGSPIIEDVAMEESTDIVEENVTVDVLFELREKLFYWECLHTSKQQLPGAVAMSSERIELVRAEIIEKIELHAMAPFYQYLNEKVAGWKRDKESNIPSSEFLSQLQQRNVDTIKQLEAKKADATENLGITEIHEIMAEEAEFYYRIGEKQQCIQKCAAVLAEMKGTSKRLDLTFLLIRLGFVYQDTLLIKEYITKAKEILKLEGDWERRNRLKVYEGLHFIQTRDFKKSSELLLDSVATFSCYELMSFKQFVFYTILVSVPTLSRVDLKTKIIENSEVLTVLPDLHEIRNLLYSVYYCKYDQFFTSLNLICEMMGQNVWLAPHVSYYYRELRVLIFKQFLASYRSVTLAKMAEAFRIPVSLLDSQLCCFIASNRLTCKIDKVAGQVITARDDAKNANYQSLLKNGDFLLNKIQKLARMVGT